jgi:hypothetical protein
MAPIRIVIRDTEDYYGLIRDGNMAKNAIHPTESVQLARGDIPYYFRYPGSADLHFFERPEAPTMATDKELGIPALSIALTNGFSNRPTDSFKKLLKAGVLQLLQFVGAKTEACSVIYDNLCLEISQESFVLNLRDEFKIGSKR